MGPRESPGTTFLHRLRRPAVLAAVGALLGPLVIGTGAGTAVADPGDPLLAVGSFAVTEGASAATGTADADGAYASDLAYDGRASSDGVVVEAEASFACASETDHCEDAEALVPLAQMTLAEPVELNGLEVTPQVEYFADAAGTVPAAQAAGAAAFRLTFREPTDGAPGLRAGTTGWLSLRAVLGAVRRRPATVR